jgi:hypothetical protein
MNNKGFSSIGFKDYFKQADDRARLKNVLYLFTFVMCPLFSVLFYWAGAPTIYSLTIASGAVVFPLIIFIEQKITLLKGKLPLLFFIYFTALTFWVIYDLRVKEFETNYFAFFTALFSVFIFSLQRFWYSFFYFLASFPIVNGERAVVQISKHNVNGAGQAMLLVKNRPLGAKRLQVLGVVCMKASKVFKFWGAIIHVIQGAAVVNTLNVIMHERSCGGGIVSSLVPRCLYFVASHAIIFAQVPIFPGHHARNDGICVKLFKVFVIPCCDGRVFYGRVVVNGVNVGTGVE